MPQSVLEVIYRTSKQGQGGKAAAAELKEVKGVVGDVSSNFLGFNAASLTAAGAIAAVGGFAIDSVKKFQAYGEQIRGLTALTGTGAEETSRLMQAFDDMGISAEQFSKLVEGSAKKGFVFTLENVKALADEYAKLPSQVDKNALLQEKLGKGASYAAKAFEEGSVAIEAYYNAVSEGQALTEKEIQAADTLRKTIDRVTDEVEANTLALGGGLATALDDIYTKQEREAKFLQATGIPTFKGMTDAQKEAAIAAWELGESEKWVAENAEEAKRMIGGYGDQAAGTTAPQLLELMDAQDQVTKSLQAYNEQLLFNVATEGMDAEAKLQIAYGLGLVDEKSRYAIVKTQEWREELRKGTITIDEYNKLVWNLAHGLAGITSKDVTVRIRYMEEHYGERNSTSKWGGEIDLNAGDGEANGTSGWVTVPQGYPNDSYLVPMSSGEQYAVMNDRQRWTGASKGSGGAVVEISGDIYISNGMDQRAFEGMLENAVRRAQRG